MAKIVLRAFFANHFLHFLMLSLRGLDYQGLRISDTVLPIVLLAEGWGRLDESGTNNEAADSPLPLKLNLTIWQSCLDIAARFSRQLVPFQVQLTELLQPRDGLGQVFKPVFLEVKAVEVRQKADRIRQGFELVIAQIEVPQAFHVADEFG